MSKVDERCLASPRCAGFEEECRTVLTTSKNKHPGQMECLDRIRHDILSPLGAVSGFLELLNSDVAGELSDRQRLYLQNARTGVAKAIAVAEAIPLGGTKSDGPEARTATVDLT